MKHARSVLTWIGCLVLIPSILLERYVQDARAAARSKERLELLLERQYFGATPDADAAYEAWIIIGWMGIGLGALWILAAITCFFLARPPMDSTPSRKRSQPGTGAPVVRSFP